MGERELLLPMVGEENICLPLPVNAVARYWDVTLPMDEAAEAAKRYGGFGGNILMEGIESAERRGLVCIVYRSSLGGLKEVLDAGVPPIVILPGVPDIAQHASVITGYSDKEDTILHYIQKGNRDGEQQEGAIPQEVFEKEWSEEARVMIAISPPGTLPDNGSKPDRMCLEAERLDALGDTDGAIRILEEAVSIDPGNPVAHGLLGGLLGRKGSPDCIASYERCIDANPRAFLAWSGLGDFYLKTGRLADAEKCYDAAISINPRRSARIYKNRAYLRDKRGDGAGAKEDLRAYLGRLPKAKDRGIIEQAIREL